jgi:hypothetical protein
VANLGPSALKRRKQQKPVDDQEGLKEEEEEAKTPRTNAHNTAIS